MPYSKHLPVSAEPGEWARKLDRIIASHKNQPFLSILVFNETGDGYGRANKILADLSLNAFYLQGGVAGYKRYLEDLMLSWLPRDSRIKTNRKCGTCVKEIEENIITDCPQVWQDKSACGQGKIRFRKHNGEENFMMSNRSISSIYNQFIGGFKFYGLEVAK